MYRGRETIRGFASRNSIKRINPLTETHERGREKLKKRKINSRFGIYYRRIEAGWLWFIFDLIGYEPYRNLLQKN